MIYLDNAGTSWPKAPGVAEAITEALASTGNPGRGAHGPALAAGRVLHRARTRASRLFGVDPGRVVLTHGATHALNIALAGLLGPGDHAITTDLEHNSVLRPLYAARDRGVRLTIARSEQGVVAPDAVAAALTPQTRVVALTHASNVLGTIQPVQTIAELCADTGIYFVLDASQTAGLLPVSLAATPIAALACSGHKGLLGPTGTGLLVLGEGVRPRPFEAGGTGVHTFSESMPDDLPEALEAGTPNVHGLAGLASSLESVLEAGAATRPSDHWVSAMAAARRLGEGLAASGRFAAPTIDPAAWGVPVLSGTVFGASGAALDPAEVADRLWIRGIAVRGGFHCAPLLHRRYGSAASGLVRFSPGHLTTDDEIDQTLDAVRELSEAS